MNYISLKKAEEYLNNKIGKKYTRSFLISQIKKGKLKANKVANEWLVTKEELDAFTEQRKERDNFNIDSVKLVLPLYFGWGLAFVKIQKKLLWPFKTYWQEATAVLLLTAIVTSTFFFYFPNSPLGVSAATYTWTQTSWTTLDAATTATHSDDTTDWVKYSASTTGISATTEVTLSPTIASSSQTDFSGGTFTNSTTTSTGDLAIATSTFTYDFTESTSTDRWAFDRGGATPTSPTDYEQEATSTYYNISISDNTRWVTASTTGVTNWDSQIYTFQLANPGIFLASSSWEGYGGTTTYMYIYDYTNTNWIETTNFNFTSASDQVLSFSTTSNLSDYLEAGTNKLSLLLAVISVKSNGQACSSGIECASGSCADSVCCDTACSGECTACTAAKTGGTDGTCANVTVDTDPDSECSDCQACNGGACANFDSAWDSGLYGCAAGSGNSAKRCYQGTCRTCGALMKLYWGTCALCDTIRRESDNKVCWRQSEEAADCDATCPGGCIAQNWNDSPTCTNCIEWAGGSAGCNTTAETYNPRVDWIGYFLCFTRSGGTSQVCSSNAPGGDRRQCICNYSPFIYIYQNNNYIFLSDFISGATSKDKEYLSFTDITETEVINNKIRLKITEELPETVYLDRIYLRVDEKEIIELSSITKADLNLLTSSDNNYLVMKKGTEHYLEFKVPETYNKLEFAAEGYYTQYWYMDYNGNIKTFYEVTSKSESIEQQLEQPKKQFSLHTDYVQLDIDRYYTTTTFNSATIDLSQAVDFTTLDWTATTTATSTIKFQLRSSANGSDWTSWYGPTGEGDYYTATGTTINTDNDNYRYIQYKVILETTDTSQTPELAELVINYQYPPVSTLISSKYNTEVASNGLLNIRWYEDLPNSSSTIKVQAKTSSTEGGLDTADWYGPSTSTDYFSSATSTCSTSVIATSTYVDCVVPAAIPIGDSSNDQWIQYQVILEGYDSSYPTLYDTLLIYGYNAAPEFSSITAEQAATSSAIIDITYAARDQDNVSVDPTFEYSINGGSSFGSVATTCLDVADYESKTVTTPTYTDFIATWNSACSMGIETNVSQAQVRITLDDGEATNNTQSTTTSNFSIDITDLTEATSIIYINLGATQDNTPPGIGSIKATEITQNSAKVSWSVSENSTGKVKYGTTISYNKEQLSQGAGRDHTTTLENLSPGTTYHFQVEAVDFSNNTGKSSDNTFTTLGEPEEELTPGEEEEEPTPGEEEEEEEGVAEAAQELISKTEELGVSEVIKRASETFIKKILEALPQNPFIKEESFIQYISQATERIVSSPVVSGDLPQVEVAATTAKVVWTTDKESNSLVAYVKQTEYDNTKEEPYTVILGNPYHQVITHEVLIENLEPSTAYHYQVRSQAKIGPITRSEDRTFTTLSQIPEISDIKFVDISPDKATVYFKTNLPAKTNLIITDTRTGKTTETEDISYLKEHQIQIEDLDISTDYSLTLIAEDEEGTRSLPSILPFSTAISLKPPEITNVRITTSLIPGRTEKVQAIISWKTSKPATSKVYYEEGISQREELQFFTKEDIILNTDHIVITTAFKPGRVYRFRVQSIDSIGNTSHSKDYTILTPKPKESVLDLIIQNFEQTFSFLQRLRF